MDWEKLLSTKRLGKDENNKKTDLRPEYLRDYDRIIFSSAFRRLQDKTQVFPLAKNDYVRTRLTHSLEVASVGRSLGTLAAQVISEKDCRYKNKDLSPDIGTIVSTACLAHDIGNPPFGHAGESAIQEWFQSNDYIKRLNTTEQADLLCFEGNAQGLRTLCSLQYAQRGGLQLTHATLGAFTKYPRSSVVEDHQKIGISGKKFGFMQSESALFEELASNLGLIKKPGKHLAWHRHPLAFLVEAADDICYHVMDVEDGFKTGYISLEEIINLHKPWLSEEHLNKGQKLENPSRRVEFFRAITIGKMIESVHHAFREHYDEILNGSYDKELTESTPLHNEFKAFKTLAKEKAYTARPVLEIEACGFEVIGGLLNAFLEAIDVKAKHRPDRQVRSRTLLGLMPDLTGKIEEYSDYERALLATDFVAGMTDSFAVSLYQRIQGISLP